MGKCNKKIIAKQLDDNKYLILQHIGSNCDLTNSVITKEQLFYEVCYYFSNDYLSLDDVLEIKDSNNNDINSDKIYEYLNYIVVINKLINL